MVLRCGLVMTTRDDFEVDEDGSSRPPTKEEVLEMEIEAALHPWHETYSELEMAASEIKDPKLAAKQKLPQTTKG